MINVLDEVSAEKVEEMEVEEIKKHVYDLLESGITSLENQEKAKIS